MDTERESDLSREHNDGTSGSPWAEVEFCHFAPSIMGTAAVVMMFSPEQPPGMAGVVPGYKASRDARSNFNKLFSVFIRQIRYSYLKSWAMGL